MRDWKEIVIHHSAAPDSRISNDWEAIRRYHTSWRYKDEIITPEKAQDLINSHTLGVIAPWEGIGYHFGLEYENNKLHYRIGRGLDKVGAHTLNHNLLAIGICCVGNYDITPPTEETYTACAQLVLDLMQIFKIPIEKIYPHRLFAPKTCPGKLFDLEYMKDIILGGKIPYDPNHDPPPLFPQVKEPGTEGNPPL